MARSIGASFYSKSVTASGYTSAQSGNSATIGRRSGLLSCGGRLRRESLRRISLATRPPPAAGNVNSTEKYAHDLVEDMAGFRLSAAQEAAVAEARAKVNGLSGGS